MPQQEHTQQNNIGYVGKVKIQKKRGNKIYSEVVVHNTGTKELFGVIANALAGNNVSSNVPKFIGTFFETTVGTTEPDWNNLTSTLARKIAFGSMKIYYGTGAGVSASGNIDYTFLIPFNIIKNTTNLIAIYNSATAAVPLAYLRLNSAAQITADGKSNVIITWTMTICNVS